METLPNEPAVGMPIEDLDVKAQAKTLPDLYFRFLEGKVGNDSQAASVLTAENLKVIKKYAGVVRTLSRSEEDIRDEVDYDALGIEVGRIVDLNTALHRHVDEWDKLERQIKELGPLIEMFAASMKSRGGALISSIQGTAAFKRIASEKEAQGGDIYFSLLTEEERGQILAVIEKRLGELIKQIERTKDQIADVDTRANWFHKEIELEIRPRLARLIRHVDDKLSSSRIDELVVKRDELDMQIDVLRAQYSAEVGYAFSGLLVGPVGLIITGGIFGSRAEHTRKEKNILVEERDALTERLANITPAVKNFEKVNSTIRDLMFRTTDLLSATQRLADTWLYLHKFARTSLDESKSLSTSADLEEFVQDFTEVIRPWQSIGSICHTLSELFNKFLVES
ncbi:MULTISPECIES: alpha-xenorhabdolysin family binary toxin subunit A [unclassified Pseudomonas]|uniref:alpha-xenorhabdolysin family binary toxin subunit A n=1 Tax=unclassified Pseudomonas TaxID=196821 RepID=UPI0035C02B89